MLKIVISALLICFFNHLVSNTCSSEVGVDSWKLNLPSKAYDYSDRTINEKQIFSFELVVWKFPEKHFVSEKPDPYVIHMSYRNGSTGTSRPFLETEVYQNTDEPKWKSEEIQFTQYIRGIRQKIRFQFRNLHPTYLDDEVIGHAYIDIDNCLEEFRSSKPESSSSCQAQIQDLDDGIIFFRLNPLFENNIKDSRSQGSISVLTAPTSWLLIVFYMERFQCIF